MNRLLAALTLLAVSACATPSESQLDAEVRRLCAIDGGIKVYETVTLPVEKSDNSGNVRIPAKNNASLTDEYYYDRAQVVLISGDPQMTKTIHKIVRRSDGKVLGTSVRCGRGGGDLAGPWHPSSFMCPAISNDTPSIESSVFLKK